jgi:hypothetical protein
MRSQGSGWRATYRGSAWESASMRELETSLQQFGEFLLKAQLVTEQAAPLLRALGPAIPHASGFKRAAVGPGAPVR